MLSGARHVLEPGIGEIAAGDLRAAFQQMAGHGAAAELHPVVERPAEGVDERPERQRRIGHAAGDHDLCALTQCFDDGTGAEIGVGGDQQLLVRQVVATGAQHLEAGGIQHVVTGDHADLGACFGARPGLRGEFRDHLRRRRWIGRTEIADDGNVAVDTIFQDRCKQRFELRLIAGRGILTAAQLCGGQCTLTQGLEDEGGAFAGSPQGTHDRKRRVEPVARIAGSRADQHAPAPVFHPRHRISFCGRRDNPAPRPAAPPGPAQGFETNLKSPA